MILKIYIYSSFKNKVWITYCCFSPSFYLYSYSLWALVIEWSQGAESKQAEKMMVCEKKTMLSEMYLLKISNANSSMGQHSIIGGKF